MKENKNRDWSKIAFTDESSFYLNNPGVSWRVLEGKYIIIVKTRKINECIGSILKHLSNQFRYFLRETWIVRNMLVYWITILIKLKRCLKMDIAMR